MDLRTINIKVSLDTSLPTDLLRKAYEDICRTKNTNNMKKFEYETTKTISEHIVASRIKKCTKLHFFTSFWIGPRNIDLFFPQLLDHGFAIEIDGGIHNEEIKMKKDQSKFSHLEKIGILTSVIYNSDKYEETVKRLIAQIKTMKRLDTRGRKRVLRNVYIYTIIHHFDLINLKDYFSLEGIDLLKAIKQQLKFTQSL